jgi:hypothetical protein
MLFPLLTEIPDVGEFAFSCIEGTEDPIKADETTGP